MNATTSWNTGIVVAACLAGTLLALWDGRSAGASSALMILMATSLAGIQRRVSLKLFAELESINRQA